VRLLRAFGSEIGSGFSPDILLHEFGSALQLAEKVLAGAEDIGFVGAPAFRPVKLRQKGSGL
jgi:hypothetical protein